MPSQQYTEMQVALQARQRLELPLLGMMWLGMLVLAGVDHNWFYLGAGSFAVGANLWAVRRRREVYAHSLFVKAGVVLSVVVMGLEMASLRVPPVLAAAHGLVLIQICKLLDHKTNRDYVQMVVISGMTVIPAAIFCTSPWGALLIPVYVVLLIHVGMVLTVKRGLEASLSAQLPGDSATANPRQALWNSMRAWPGGSMGLRVPLVALAFFAAGTAFFLIAPRESRSFTMEAMLEGPSRLAVAAHRPQVVLGQARRIHQSDEVVMRVQTPRHSPSIRYLRGATYDSYRQARWYSKGSAGSYLPPLPLPPELRQALVTVNISMDRSLLPWLFTPYPTLWVAREGEVQRGDRELSYFWQEERLEDRPIVYQANVWPQPLAAPQREALAEQRRLYEAHTGKQEAQMDVPPLVEATARQWCRDLLEQRRFGTGDPDALDMAIAQHLARQLGQHCGYTLDLTGVDPDREPLEDFLFHTRRGNCEYFASALAVMASSLGVKARLASGYLMHEFNPVTRQYVVRQRDAHAWVEVFTPSGDWQIVDATPLACQAPPREGLPALLGQYVDAVQAFWYGRILGYNGYLRERLGLRIWEASLVLWHAGRLRVQQAGRWAWEALVSGETELILARLSGLLGVLALGVFALLLWRTSARARHRRARAKGQCWANLLLVPELVDRLGDSSHGEADFATLRERALGGAASLGLDSAVIGRLVDLYYRARWGGWSADEQTVQQARRQARQLALSGGIRLGRQI